MEGILAKTDYNANKQRKTGAEKGLEDVEGRERPNQALECTAPFTSNAAYPSFPSISDMNPSSDKTSPNIMLPTSFPTLHTGWLATSNPGTYEDGHAQLSSTYTTNSNAYSVGSNTNISITDMSKNAGWSVTSHSTSNNGLYNAPASNISSVVGYPPGSTSYMPVYLISTVESTNRDVSLTHCHNGGPPASVLPQQWVPRPFIPIIRSIAHPALGPVPATSLSNSRLRSPIGNVSDRDENEDLD
ncbi:hypothetical protein AAF712_012006 [Marasmius tenuissimus]|uniref:Uncharacterized protein n=1 Tax=Marasmius tenuissimus TaxID=585030 RepID=A0ABR2ZJL1_9AGAR